MNVMASRKLWLEPEVAEKETVKQATIQNKDSHYDDIFRKFSSRPPRQPFLQSAYNSLVVGQEFILSILILVFHRTVLAEEATKDLDATTARLLPSIVWVWLALFLVVLHNQPTDESPSRKTKVRQRSSDAVFMAVLLRFLSAVLKTLTASYSSDTVHALVSVSLLLHLLACDYSYANGWKDCLSREVTVSTTGRPSFQGGTISLTAAFFATILLASRLENNAAVYVFVCFSVILFALYPAARHQVAINTKTTRVWVPPVITVMLAVATFLLLEVWECFLVVAVLFVLCVCVPLWKFVLQDYKTTLRGPWDIAHV